MRIAVTKKGGNFPLFLRKNGFVDESFVSEDAAAGLQVNKGECKFSGQL